MADLRLSANILFAQSIKEKENSKRTLLFEPYRKCRALAGNLPG